MGYDVKVVGSIRDVGVGFWDDLITASGAPVFYSSQFVGAFERGPLHAIDEARYILGFDGDELTFGLPAYLVRGVDPMRLLHDHYPGLVDQPVLLSHVWHCYDTWLPARRLDREVVELAVEAMRATALESGAAAYGLVNVCGDGALARILEDMGLPGIDVDRRFTADLNDFENVEGYLSALPSKERCNMRRYRTRAEQAGAQISFGVPATGDLDGFVALARVGAAKYGNAGFYREGLFQEFVLGLGESARLLEMRHEGRLVGAAIVLVDGRRLHFWACGSDYTALPGVSPFYLAFLATIEEALTDGRTAFEAGRRNESFKLRYGMRPRPVRAYVVPTSRKVGRS
jgi:predicted N-acyltransferase